MSSQIESNQDVTSHLLGIVPFLFHALFFFFFLLFFVVVGFVFLFYFPNTLFWTIQYLALTGQQASELSETPPPSHRQYYVLQVCSVHA